MRKLLLWLSLFFCCIAAAQPTSFGGITPGKTTLNELKSLFKEDDFIVEKGNFAGQLKQPERVSISGNFRDDVVYKIEVSIHSPELKQGLITKYGVPKIKVGSIRTVTCKNKFGASFSRLDGKEELRWPANEGVQGGIERLAGNCGDQIYETYSLRHNATIKAIEAEYAAEARKESEKSRRKFDGAL